MTPTSNTPVRPSTRAEYMVRELGLNDSWTEGANKIVQSRTRMEASKFLVNEMLRHDGTGRNHTAELVFTAMRMGIEIGMSIAEDEAISPFPVITDTQKRIEEELQDDPE